MDQDFKPNWLAIGSIVLGLVVIGWLLGLLSAAPDGRTITCPNEASVSTIETERGVVVYCEN